MLHAAFADELNLVRDSWREQGLSVALVPTMGNLHAGHLALVREAEQLADRVVVSIFVNPTQFGEGEDFSSYPRTLDTDIEQLKNTGAHLVFSPGADVLYPNGVADSVRVSASPSLAGMLEGASRPGHFDGVVTVVSRLFNRVDPDVAVFGEKDYQQLLVIRRMAEDLGYRTRIHAVETVREPEGLAMSSRNNFLDSAERQAAAHISQLLNRVTGALSNGADDFKALERDGARWLGERGLRVEYVAIRREDNLEIPTHSDCNLRVLVAARAGTTRLIDNKSSHRICN